MTIPVELRGCDEKLRRAKRHTDELQASVDAIRKNHAYRFVDEFDPKTRKVSFQLRLDPDPTLEWGVILGDFVHNVRSALDHLVYQLAALNVPEPSGTAFPIFVRERRRPDVENDKGFFPDGRALIRKVPDDCKPFFECFQPYQRQDGPEYHILEVLRMLSNEDKHKVVPTTPLALFATGIEGMQPLPLQHIERVEHFVLHIGKPLGEDQEIAHAQVIPNGPDPKMKLDGDPEFFIALRHADPVIHGRDMYAVARALLRYASIILETFEPAFSGHTPVLAGPI